MRKSLRRVSVLMPKPLKRGIERAAGMRGMSMSEWVREAAKKALEDLPEPRVELAKRRLARKP